MHNNFIVLHIHLSINNKYFYFEKRYIFPLMFSQINIHTQMYLDIYRRSAWAITHFLCATPAGRSMLSISFRAPILPATSLMSMRFGGRAPPTMV